MSVTIIAVSALSADMYTLSVIHVVSHLSEIPRRYTVNVGYSKVIKSALLQVPALNHDYCIIFLSPSLASSFCHSLTLSI